MRNLANIRVKSEAQKAELARLRSEMNALQRTHNNTSRQRNEALLNEKEEHMKEMQRAKLLQDEIKKAREEFEKAKKEFQNASTSNKARAQADLNAARAEINAVRKQLENEQTAKQTEINRIRSNSSTTIAQKIQELEKLQTEMQSASNISQKELSVMRGSLQLLEEEKNAKRLRNANKTAETQNALKKALGEKNKIASELEELKGRRGISKEEINRLRDNYNRRERLIKAIAGVPSKNVRMSQVIVDALHSGNTSVTNLALQRLKSLNSVLPKVSTTPSQRDSVEQLTAILRHNNPTPSTVASIMESLIESYKVKQPPRQVASRSVSANVRALAKHYTRVQGDRKGSTNSSSSNGSSISETLGREQQPRLQGGPVGQHVGKNPR